MRPSFPQIVLAGLALSWGAWSTPALAGTLQVNPILVEINSFQRTGSVTITNQEDAPVTIRAHAFAWHQTNGENVYEPSDELILSPPVFTIAPRATQTVRVGQRRPGAEPKAYRLIIEEVPEASPQSGIRIALRLDLPLFIHIAPAPEAALLWSARREANGAFQISVRNPTQGYVRVDHELATRSTGLAFADSIFFGTLLPGGSRQWILDRPPEVVDAALFQNLTQTDPGAPAQAIRGRR